MSVMAKGYRVHANPDGAKAQNISDFAGLLRSGDSCTFHESRLGSVGCEQQSFHQGFAKEADDPKIIAAALAKPGVILKRPVGTNELFVEMLICLPALPTRAAQPIGNPPRIPRRLPRAT
jgi:hypothetical protein